MNHRFTQLAYILFGLTLVCSAALASDQYWVSFSGVPPQHMSGYPKFVLKIDSLGNVLMPATKIFKGSGTAHVGDLGGGTAISSNGPVLNMWFAGFSGSFVTFPLYRAVIQKRSLNVLAVFRTPVHISNSEYLGVTHQLTGNFLAVEISESPPQLDMKRYAAFAISGTGAMAVPLQSWLLFPDSGFCDGIPSCPENISSDGRVLVLQKDHPNRVIAQPLGGRGRPIEVPVVIDKGPYLDPLDISDTLHGNRRLVLYSFQGLRSALFVRVVDARTLTSMEKRILVASSVGVGPQEAVIDPRGRFVLYGAEGLMFQALDETGGPSGSAKSLFKFKDASAVFGIDIVAE